MSRKEKKKNGILKVFIVLICIVCIIIGIGGIFIWSKLNLMEYAKLDKDKLGIENTLQEVNKHLEEDIKEKDMKKIKNILLLGSDTRNTQNMSAGRSDTMIVFSINPMKNSIKLISIPRDSYVNIEGRGMDKLNHAYAYGGEELLIKTINQNFNLNITDYVTIDFTNLAKIIDEIGGVEVEIDEAERRYINAGSPEIYRLIGTKRKVLNSSGKVILDGPQAVTYARDRTNGNDFSRQMRQQNVVKGAINKITTLSMDRIMSLVDTCLKQVRTNVNVLSYTGLLTDVLAQRDEYMQNIYQAQIPDQSFGVGKKINGIYYLTYDDAEAQRRFADYIYNK